MRISLGVLGREHQNQGLQQKHRWQHWRQPAYLSYTSSLPRKIRESLPALLDMFLTLDKDQSGRTSELPSPAAADSSLVCDASKLRHPGDVVGSQRYWQGGPGKQNSGPATARLAEQAADRRSKILSDEKVGFAAFFTVLGVKRTCILGACSMERHLNGAAPGRTGSR